MSPRRVRACFFCQNKQVPDYKEAETLKQFVSSRGKILARSQTGLCRKHQKRLAVAIKRARHLAFLPFMTKAR